MLDELRQIVSTHGKLLVPIQTLGDNADLFAAGMDSLAVVNVMMSIEERFGVELPDSLLNRQTFSSIAALGVAVQSVLPA
jgi:acyl carrier protein